MKEKPLVSIIIPVYNAAGTITSAIESVLNQVYPNKELIIIDGLSDDGSLPIIQSFNGRISYHISEKDNGVYCAINKGLDQAKGDWIYILGADDKLHDFEVLQKVMTSEINQEKIIFGNIKNEDRLHLKIPIVHRCRFDQSVLWRNTLHQQGVLYHRDIFEKFRFDETMRVLADYDLHLLLYHLEIKSRYIDLFIASCNARGLSKQFGWKLYSEELKMKRKRRGILFWLVSIPVVLTKFLYKKI